MYLAAKQQGWEDECSIIVMVILGRINFGQGKDCLKLGF